MRADAGAADRDNADALVRPVSQPLPQLGAAAEGMRMLPDDVAGEIEVLRNPVAHRRQILAERHGNDVLRLADEYGAVAQPGWLSICSIISAL